jgi:hypothetical protein
MGTQISNGVNKKYILIIVAAIILIAGSVYYYFAKQKSPEPVACTMEAKLCPDGSYVGRVPPNCEFAPCPLEEQTVKLFYYSPEKDKDENGNVLCSRNGLASVERKISKNNVIENAVRLLLEGKLTDEEKTAGITTEYPLEGLKLIKNELKNNNLTLTFDDSLGKTVGGSCRVGILWFQIEATAKQFPEVRQVHFLPEELFQP